MYEKQHNILQIVFTDIKCHFLQQESNFRGEIFSFYNSILINLRLV